ncbi:MAG TPA: helix-hairpin-helix domain-containing protein [Thermoanaerobaculia bacterium]
MVRRSRLIPVLLSVVLGWALAAAPAQAAKSKSGKVNLNTATQEELEALPGVGEATAKKIIASRPYASVDDLSKAGVSASTISKIKSKVTVSGGGAPAAEKSAESSSSKKSKSSTASTSSEKASAQSTSAKKATAEPKESAGAEAHGRIDVNTASESELEALPGIGASSAKKIIAARPYKSLDDLSRSGVSSSSLEKARPHLMVSKAQKVEPAVAGAPGVGAGSSSSRAKSQPASTSAPSGASSTGTSATSSSASTRNAPKDSSSEGEPEVAARTAPAAGMVWVNTATKVYHYEGDRWYGKTKEGKFMTEADAVKAGFRASKEGAPKTQ